MAVLKIVQYGSPILRQKAKSVKKIDAGVRRLAELMIATMHQSDGIGLAAPQIGKSINMFVVDVGPIEEGAQPMVFINTEILAGQGSGPYKEGCLSIPGVYGEVARPEKIRLRYTDLAGKTHEVAADGILARVIQHENDHCNGKLFIDYLEPAALEEFRSELDALELKYKGRTGKGNGT